MHTFTLNITPSSRQEIIVQKDSEPRRVRVRGIDAEVNYGAEDTKDLAALFAGVEKMLTD